MHRTVAPPGAHAASYRAGRAPSTDTQAYNYNQTAGNPARPRPNAGLPWRAPPPLLAQLPAVLHGFANLDWATDLYLQRILAGFFRAHFETVCLPHVRRPPDEVSLKALADGLAPAAIEDDPRFVPGCRGTGCAPSDAIGCFVTSAGGDRTLRGSALARLRYAVLRTYVRYYLTAFQQNRADLTFWAISACRLVVLLMESVRVGARRTSRRSRGPGLGVA